MGRDHNEWERGTLELLSLEQGERKKLEQRLVSVQQALSELDSRIVAIQSTLDAYRQRHGLSQNVGAQVAASIVEEYKDLGHKEMVLQWATTHGGEVRTREMNAALAAAGIFKDNEHAAGALFPAIGRLPGLEKIGRGIYKMNPKEIDNALAVKYNGQYEQAEQAGASESDRVLSRGKFDSQYGQNDGDSEEHGTETTG